MGGTDVNFNIRAQDQASSTVRNVAAAFQQLANQAGLQQRAYQGASSGVDNLLSRMTMATTVGNLFANAIMKVTSAISAIPTQALAATGMIQNLEMSMVGMIAREISRGETIKRTAMQAYELTEDEAEEVEKLEKRYKELSNSVALNEARVAEATAKGQAGTIAYASLNMTLEKQRGELTAVGAQWQELIDKTKTLVPVVEEITTGTMLLSEAYDEATERSKAYVEALSDLAIYSPFRLDAVTGTYKQALAFGFAADEAMDFTDALLNMAAGLGMDNERLSRTAYNFAQIRMVGKVTAMDLRQLAMAGFPLMDVLKDVGAQFGVNVKDIAGFNKALASGQIQWSDFTAAFKSYADRNFGEASKRMSTTLMGLQSSFSDIITLTMPRILSGGVQVFTEFFSEILNEIVAFRKSGQLEEWNKQLTEWAKDAVAALKEFGPKIKEAFEWVAANGNGVGEAIKAIAASIVILKAAFVGLEISKVAGLFAQLVALQGVSAVAAATVPTVAAAAGQALFYSAAGAPLITAGAAAGAGAGAPAAGAAAGAAGLASGLMVATLAITATAVTIVALNAVLQAKVGPMREQAEGQITAFGAEISEALKQNPNNEALWELQGSFEQALESYRRGYEIQEDLFGEVQNIPFGIDRMIEAMAAMTLALHNTAGVIPTIPDKIASRWAAYQEAIIRDTAGRAEAQAKQDRADINELATGIGDAVLGKGPRTAAERKAAGIWQPGDPSQVGDIPKSKLPPVPTVPFGGGGVANTFASMYASETKKLLEVNAKILEAQEFLKAHPGDPIARGILDGLLKEAKNISSGGQKGDYAANLMTAFKGNVGAALAWEKEFEKVQGRKPGAVDLRDMVEGLLFSSMKGSDVTLDEWKERWKTGAFPGIGMMEKGQLDAMYGPGGTLPAALEAAAQSEAEHINALLRNSPLEVTMFIPPTAGGGGGSGGGSGAGGGGGSTCFVGNTLVDTPHGERLISQLEPGDKVWSWHEDRKVPASIVKRIIGQRHDLIEVITARGFHVRCSPNHPFLTQRGWVEASNLEVDIDFWQTDSGLVKVTSIKPFIGEHVVYDLEVDHPAHTYLVHGYVVHNKEQRAYGGLVNYPTLAYLAEKGPEMVVPLKPEYRGKGNVGVNYNLTINSSARTENVVADFALLQSLASVMR